MSNKNDHESKRKSRGIQRPHQNRRSVLSAFGTGASLSLFGIVPRRTSARSDPVDKFDPLKFEVDGRSWEGKLGGPEFDKAAITIRRTLVLNKVYEGINENVFEFALSTFGLALREGYDGSDLENQIHPMTIFGSDHTITSRSSDFNMNEVTTNAPRIGEINPGEGAEVLEEHPGFENNWTTNLEDLEEAKVDISGDDLPLILGAAGLGLGIVAGAPTLGTGTATILTGTSAVLGAGSLVSSLDNEYDRTRQDSSKWEYEMKNEGLAGPDPISGFVHNAIINVPVPHNEYGHVKITSEIGNSGTRPVPQKDPHDWIGSYGDTDYFDVFFSNYENAEEARSSPPSITSKPGGRNPPPIGPRRSN